jgi:hypothetical protein
VPEKFDIRVFEKPTPILDVIKEMLNQWAMLRQFMYF